MHIHRKFWFHFFLWITLFLNFEIWRKWKVLLKQLVSTTPLKHLNRIAWNFEVMKDIMCRYAFLKEIMIWSFWGGIYIPFFCPIARHKCLELPFIVYSILKQCWSVGYVSLLTLSFIILVHNILQLYCFKDVVLRGINFKEQ